MDVREAGKATLQGLPPIGVTITGIAGLTLQQWVYVVTILYTLIQIIRLFPKIIGCAVCFWKHGTCDLNCKGD